MKTLHIDSYKVPAVACPCPRGLGALIYTCNTKKVCHGEKCHCVKVLQIGKTDSKTMYTIVKFGLQF